MTDDADLALAIARRVAFSSGDVAEFRQWISNASGDDLMRHAARLASAERLHCFDAQTARSLREALAARRAALTPVVRAVPQPQLPMSTPNEPDALAATRAKLRDALLRAEAAAALNVTASRYAELFLPSLLANLRVGPDDEVQVLDEDGEVRRGVGVALAARELRAKYPTL